MNILAWELIQVAKDMGELSWKIITTPYGKLTISSMNYPNYYYRIRRLEKDKLIKKLKRSTCVTYRLTYKGRESLRHKPKLESRSDGLLTMIIFDIPVTKNSRRTTFRRYLLRYGFLQIQRSVLISNFGLNEQIIQMINKLHIRDNVKIFSSKTEII